MKKVFQVTGILLFFSLMSNIGMYYIPMVDFNQIDVVSAATGPSKPDPESPKPAPKPIPLPKPTPKPVPVPKPVEVLTPIVVNPPVIGVSDPDRMILRFTVGQKDYISDGEMKTMETNLLLKNNLTYVPLRLIAESMGADVSWEQETRKITVIKGNIVIVLWPNKNSAQINGVDTLIDPNQSTIIPEIIEGRTMLPFAFVVKTLGCDISWDPSTKSVYVSWLKNVPVLDVETDNDEEKDSDDENDIDEEDEMEYD